MVRAKLGIQGLVVLSVAALAVAACKGKGGSSGGGSSPAGGKINGGAFGDSRPVSALSEEDISFMTSLWKDDQGKTYIFAKNGTLVTENPSSTVRWKRDGNEITMFTDKGPQKWVINIAGRNEILLTEKATYKAIKLSSVRRVVNSDSWINGLKDEESPLNSLSGVSATERTYYDSAQFFTVTKSLNVNKSQFTDLQDSTVYGNSFDPSSYKITRFIDGAQVQTPKDKLFGESSQSACNVKFNTMIGLFEPGSPATTSTVLTPGAQLKIRKIQRLSESNMSLRFTYGIEFELEGNRFGLETISIYFSGVTAPSSHTLLADKYEYALHTCFKGVLELKYKPAQN